MQNDLIRRKDVLWITKETGALETQSRVKELPAVDAVPVVHGRWEWKVQRYECGFMSLSGTYPTCNLCGYFEVGVDKSTPYCPNCGAEMDKTNPE